MEHDFCDFRTHRVRRGIPIRPSHNIPLINLCVVLVLEAGKLHEDVAFLKPCKEIVTKIYRLTEQWYRCILAYNFSLKEQLLVLIHYYFDYESARIWRSEALEMSRHDR